MGTATKLGITEPVRAFTLVELLCTVAILAVLLSLLLPALRQGKARVRQTQCAGNLRQQGLAFHNFASAHQDKFPMQVSTNAGGTLEFLHAGYSVGGEFYFSHRHFAPLAPDLANPRILICPSDTRIPATNFTSLKNDNLSYFVAANPRLAASDSILTGDRNIAPLFGSLARVGGPLYLKWTAEMHKFRGNVLFADTHVEEMKQHLKLTNAPTTEVSVILVPSVKPLVQPSTPGQGPVAGTIPIPGGAVGSFSAVHWSGTNAAGRPVSGITNISVRPARAQPLMVGTLSGGSPGTPPLVQYTNQQQPALVTNSGTALKVVDEEPNLETEIAQAHDDLVSQGRRLVGTGWTSTYRFPWLLLVILLLAICDLLRRMHARRRAAQESKRTSIKSDPHFGRP